MKITILGSGSSFSVPHRNPSAYLIEVDKRLYLIDAGEGVSRQLVRYGKDLRRITCIFISHTHADHVAGLIPLLQQMHLIERKEPINIFLPRGVLPGFHMVFPYFQVFQEKYPFRFELFSISAETIIEENKFRISAIPNKHLAVNSRIAEKIGIGCDSYSFHLSSDHNGDVIYTSDIDSLDHLANSSLKAKVLISECMHVSVEKVIEFAHNAGISRLIFTHIPPELESKIPRIKKPESMTVEFANDGDVIEA